MNKTVIMLKWALVGLVAAAIVPALAAAEDDATVWTCSNAGYGFYRPLEPTGAYPYTTDGPVPTYVDVGIVVNEPTPAGPVWVNVDVEAQPFNCIQQQA